MCTPASANPELLRQCAAKGVKAAFLTSAGYGEAGEDEVGRAEKDLDKVTHNYVGQIEELVKNKVVKMELMFIFQLSLNQWLILVLSWQQIRM